MVGQEPVLFALSIADNIKYGKVSQDRCEKCFPLCVLMAPLTHGFADGGIVKPEATLEEVQEAAKLANAHEFISNFDQGYETLVGERGRLERRR